MSTPQFTPTSNTSPARFTIRGSTCSTLPVMRILYGRKLNSPEHEEQILLTDAFPFHPARFAKVRELAARDGFAHFRETVDDGSAPNFAQTIAH